MLSRIACVDAGIVKEIKAILPMGPQCLTKCPDLETFKWEYAIVLFTSLEDIRNTLNGPEHNADHIAYTKLVCMHGEFCHPINYANFLRHIKKILPESTPSNSRGLSRGFHELLDEMHMALSKDILAFDEEIPERFLGSLDNWKTYEAYRMLAEMGMQRTDAYSSIRALYKMFLENRQSPDRLRALQAQDVYREMRLYMSLLERIQLLERRLELQEK